MSEENTLFESETQEKIEDVVRFLRQLADAMSQRGKHVQLRTGETTYSFRVPDLVSLEIELEDEESEQGLMRELEIEIGWLETAKRAKAEEEE